MYTLIGDRFDCEHAYDRAERLAGVPGGRRGGGRPLGSTSHGLPTVRSLRHSHGLVRQHHYQSW